MTMTRKRKKTLFTCAARVSRSLMSPWMSGAPREGPAAAAASILNMEKEREGA